MSVCVCVCVQTMSVWVRQWLQTWGGSLQFMCGRTTTVTEAIGNVSTQQVLLEKARERKKDKKGGGRNMEGLTHTQGARKREREREKEKLWNKCVCV